MRIFRCITAKFLKAEDLEIIALDISNQLPVENIRNYYTVLDIVYRALKRNEPNGRMYFDIDKEKRKQLDGLDFRERGKKRREASSYFKIYSKRKEEEATGKSTAGHVTALRGELTLKGTFLKNQGLSKLSGITKENLERVLRNTLAETIITGVNAEIRLSLEHLRKIFTKDKTKRVRENILINEFHIFDEKLIDIVLIPEIMGVGERQCRNLKKQVLEVLEKSSRNGEIKKSYSDNFKRLKKLLKKVAKVDIIIDITKTGVNISWENKDLQKNSK